MGEEEKAKEREAFPCPIGHVECNHPGGMTLREWYAGMAMQGILCGEWMDVQDCEILAKISFEVADAMMKRSREALE